MNIFPWKVIEESSLKQTINTYFSQAQRQEISGKRGEAQKEIIKALKLEKIMEKSQKPVTTREEIISEPTFKRGDVFTRTYLAQSCRNHEPGIFRNLFNRTPLMELSQKKVDLPFI